MLQILDSWVFENYVCTCFCLFYFAFCRAEHGASDRHAALQEGQFHAKGVMQYDTGFVSSYTWSHGVRSSVEGKWQSAFPLISNYTVTKIRFSMPLLRTSGISLLLVETCLQNRWGWWHACQESAAWHFHWREAGQGTNVISDVLVGFLHSLTLLSLQYLQKTFVFFGCGGKDCPLKLLVANENQCCGWF